MGAAALSSNVAAICPARLRGGFQKSLFNLTVCEGVNRRVEEKPQRAATGIVSRRRKVQLLVEALLEMKKERGTLLTIVAFGAMTLFLHHEFLQGDCTAVALAVFIAIFWTLRIVVDFVYFEHSDWPKGIQFVVGHFFLTALFAALAVTYWTLVVWSLLK
jgi:hypothetical protein